MNFNKLAILTATAYTVNPSAAASIYDIASTSDGFGTLGKMQ